MRVMVTGITGQLGGRLMSLQGSSWAAKHTLVGCDRTQWDMEAPEGILSLLEKVRPEAVIHCAAYTAVDAAEGNAELAMLVNADAPRHLAVACAALGVHLIHVSTDYVFDGTGQIPYTSDAPTSPIGVYGKSKLQGEKAVLAAHPGASVIRVSWLYDREGENFFNTMLRLSQTQDELKVVDDQVGCPTHAGHLAVDLLRWLDALEDPKKATSGVHHYGHAGTTTWHGFASAILASLAPHVRVLPVPTSAYPTLAKRPDYSKLDERAFFDTVGSPAVGWREALDACIQAKFPSQGTH